MAIKTADKTTLDRIAQAHPKIRVELGKIYQEILAALSGRADCRFAYVIRSFAEQAALYAQGRKTLAEVNRLRATAKLPPITIAQNKSKVTNAPAGLSIHQYGLAIDTVLIIDKKTASWDTITDFDGDGVSDWMEIVAVFKKYGWSWGGNWTSFKDLPHFEKTLGYTPSDLLVLKNTGKVDAQGYVLI